MSFAALLERLGLRPRVVASSPPAPILASRVPGAIPTGPAPGSRLTQEFVREIGRFAYFWAWPLVNVFNRYNSFKRLPLWESTRSHRERGEG
jgi:hypothetical protein